MASDLWRRVKELERLTRRPFDPLTVIRVTGGLADGRDIAQVDHTLLERDPCETMPAFEERVFEQADAMRARLIVFGGLAPNDY